MVILNHIQTGAGKAENARTHKKRLFYFILFYFRLQYQNNSHQTVELLPKIYLETSGQFFTSFSFSTTFVVSIDFDSEV